MLNSNTLSARLEGGRTGRFPTLWQAAAARLDLWRRRQRERRELALLSDRDLLDFGATRGDAAAETRKPFWRS